MSCPVSTAWTPGTASAAAVSIATILACGYGDSAKAAHSIPSRDMSTVYCASPLTLILPSMRASSCARKVRAAWLVSVIVVFDIVLLTRTGVRDRRLLQFFALLRKLIVGDDGRPGPHAVQFTAGCRDRFRAVRERTGTVEQGA